MSDETKENVKKIETPEASVEEDSIPLRVVKMTVPEGAHSICIDGTEISIKKGTTHLEIPEHFEEKLTPFGYTRVPGQAPSPFAKKPK
jgi:hypothetical protein